MVLAQLHDIVCGQIVDYTFIFSELGCFCFATDNFDIRQTWVLCNFLIQHKSSYTFGLFLYPLKTLENRFSDVFRGYRKWPVL